MGYAAVSLGLFILLFTFFTINTPESSTEKSQASASLVNYCELADQADAPTFKAPPDNITKTDSADDPSLGTVIQSSKNCGDTNDRHQFPDTLTTYRLIRKNVALSTKDVKEKKENFTGENCHFDSADSLNIEIPEVDKTKYKVYFPEISGEISLSREIPSRTRERDSNLLYFIDYGLVFLLHLDPEGNFVAHQGTTLRGTYETFYLADVYQDIESGRPELPPDAFACDLSSPEATKSASLKQQVVIPGQTNATDPAQLQLQYFVFQGGGEVVNGWGIHCKPAIYLYPPQKQLVNVKVHPSGFLTYVDPPYDKEKGWTVWAEPSGKLNAISSQPSAISKSYDYLYFESKVYDHVIRKPETGWVVKFDELITLYQDVLPKLGLNKQQTADFTSYWQKALPEAPYYFVGIIDQENVNQIERLEITPKPDSINRVRVYFERLDSPKAVEEPSAISSSSLSGLRAEGHQSSAKDRKLKAESEFSVVEWGGMVKNDPNHPFTCSQ